MSNKATNKDRVLFETECMNGILNNDSGSFEKLFNYYCQSLINFSRRYVWDKQIAENIVQDVFVRVWTNRTNLDPSKSIKPYLFTSVKNESLKHLRHLDVEQRGNEQIINPNSPETNPDKKFEQTELEIKVSDAIKNLPEKCREIFSMSRFDKLTYLEIAQILNISIKTVETQMGRALKKLRENLKPFLTLLLAVTSMIYFVL